MSNNPKFDFSVNKDDNSITVVREFAAPQARVWEAWTRAELLDQWWAPKPWKAATKELELKPGGRWLYAMTGPDGTQHWSRAIYQTVDAPSSFSWEDAFSDSEGNVTDEFPGSQWDVAFHETDRTTTVTIHIRHRTAADLEKILQMGFQGGFSMGLSNLDELLAQSA